MTWFKTPTIKSPLQARLRSPSKPVPNEKKKEPQESLWFGSGALSKVCRRHSQKVSSTQVSQTRLSIWSLSRRRLTLLNPHLVRLVAAGATRRRGGEIGGHEYESGDRILGAVGGVDVV